MSRSDAAPTMQTSASEPLRGGSSAQTTAAPGDRPSPSPQPGAASTGSGSPKSPHVARPSAFSIRNDFSKVQTRIRARSINSGKGVSASNVVLPRLEPTLAGSPVLPNFDSFLSSQGVGGSSIRASEAAGTDAGGGRGPEVDDYYEPNNPSGTETGSTRSDSPLETPRDSDFDDTDAVPRFRLEGPSRRGSSAEREERELWRSKGEHEEDLKTVEGRHRSKSLEGMTRMGLRRGRSFTSLLNNGQGGQASPSNAASPKLERSLRELYQPPNSTIPETHDESDSKPPSPVLRPVEPFSARGSISSTAPLLYPPTPMTDNSLGSEAFLAADAATTKSLRDFVPQLVILVALFVSSFAVIFAFISTLPGLFLPHSVADLPQLTATLSAYRGSSFLAELHLFGVLTVLFLWKQCFSIPGSVLTNILFGALYGTTMGTWWACLWTATGSTGAYLIALVIAPLVEYYFATPLAMTRRALKLPDPTTTTASATDPSVVVPISSSDLFSHLLLARFFPLLPYSVLNVISGVLRLPLGPFFVTLLIGSFPFNFATVSIGNLVALAASDPNTPLGDKIWSKEVVVKLVAVTLISVLPLAFKEQLKRILTNSGGFVERFKDSLSRMLFGFGSVPSSATVHLPAYPSGGSTTTGGGGRRGWQRKFKASIGSASEFVSQGFHLGPGRRNAYERVASDVGLPNISPPPPHFAEGEDDAEMGGVHHPR